MGAIRGTIQNGKVVFDAPPDWPNGTAVAVEPVAERVPDDEDDSAEAIRQRLALMDRFEAWMSPEELAAWGQARAADKAFQLAQWEKWLRQAEGPRQ